MFNISEFVANKTGSVLFVRKDGQYFCSESWHGAHRKIFETKGTIEFIDLDNNYTTTNVTAKAEPENYSLTVRVPATFADESKYLEITYSVSGGIVAKEVASNISEEIGARVKTINGMPPDIYGNINISDIFPTGPAAPVITWARGSINGDTGVVFDSETRLVSEYVDVSEFSSVSIMCDDGYQCAIHCYDANKNVINASLVSHAGLNPGGWVSGTRTVTIPDELYFVRFLISRTDAGTIELAESDKVSFTWPDASNGANAGTAEYYTPQVQEFADLFNNTVGLADSFLFFSDPHMASDSDLSARFNVTLDGLKTVYEQTPTSFVVCGGDWLFAGNTKSNACWLLGKIDGAMKARFNRYVNLVGNHDTNYQGHEWVQSGYDSNESDKCKLSKETIRNLWYRQQGNAYFAYDGDCTRYYVFDTGTDWESVMTDYRWEQVHWFANALLTDKTERSAAIMHISASLGTTTATPFLSAVTQIAAAYNAKTSISLNGKSYDFAQAVGHFYFVMSGHQHADANFAENGIPVVITTNLWANSNIPSFDLVLIDYGANKLHLVRVGEGENRTITMA